MMQRSRTFFYFFVENLLQLLLIIETLSDNDDRRINVLFRGIFVTRFERLQPFSLALSVLFFVFPPAIA